MKKKQKSILSFILREFITLRISTIKTLKQKEGV